jgi:hypothetical protein
VEFFHACGKGESFGEAITRFRPSGLKMKLARSATVGILIPTKPMMWHLDLRKFETFEEVQCVEDCRVMYASECLYHRDGNFVTPMPIKSGEMVFLCNYGDAYKNYTKI